MLQNNLIKIHSTLQHVIYLNKLYILICSRVDGGVSRNNFVCQFLADASGIHVERARNPESSIMGATFAAGINYGLWKSFDDVSRFRDIERIFEPQKENFQAIRDRSFWSLVLIALLCIYVHITFI